MAKTHQVVWSFPNFHPKHTPKQHARAAWSFQRYLATSSQALSVTMPPPSGSLAAPYTLNRFTRSASARALWLI